MENYLVRIFYNNILDKLYLDLNRILKSQTTIVFAIKRQLYHIDDHLTPKSDTVSESVSIATAIPESSAGFNEYTA